MAKRRSSDARQHVTNQDPTRPTEVPDRAMRLAARIVVLHCPDPAVRKIWVLERRSLPIGRAPNGEVRTVVIDDDHMSRTHATIDWDPSAGRFRITDADSRNGSFVEGRRIQSQTLDSGMLLRLGTTLFLFEIIALDDRERLEPERASLLGPSIAMQRVRGEIELAASSVVPVLILGETGVGKDVVAEEIHRRSGRSGRFVPINCGGLPEALVERELFGHARGAFTGADADAGGLFAAAAGGTVFLDEIGEMPLSVQPKLLRALDKSEVRAVGSTQLEHIDARFVAATNRDLREDVDRGRFRADLYARLGGMILRIPPLRQRRDDILPLAKHILARSRHATETSAEAAEALLLHPWPFNVRELDRVISAAALRASEKRIALADLPAELRAACDPNPSKECAWVTPIELAVARDIAPSRTGLSRVLAHYRGNVAKTAEFFGKNRKQVYRWAENLDLDPERFRDGSEEP